MTRCLRRYQRPTRPVGESASVHGYSDEFLARHGEPAARVLAELTATVAGAAVVGHNVGFDRRMLVAHARRLGLRLELLLVVDTYELARRFVGGPDLTLHGLCERLGTTARRTHRAPDDVAATLELLARLLPDVERTAPARREAVEGLRRAFLPLAEL